VELSGVIPQLRYLIHAKVPLDRTFYLSLSEVVRYNLTDKGEGPVAGFEQNRVYAGIGFNAGKRARIGFGYLWRYQREPVGASLLANLPAPNSRASSLLQENSGALIGL